MTKAVHPTSEDYAEAFRIAIDEFRKELRARGITDKYLVRKLKQGLNAKITKVFNDKDDGIVYSKPLVDYKTRREYLDMALKLEDLYPSEKHRVEHEGIIKLYAEPINKPDDAGT